MRAKPPNKFICSTRPRRGLYTNMFLEYGALDAIETLEAPDDTSAAYQPPAFIDANGNGLDDGRETQANIYQALFNTLE